MKIFIYIAVIVFVGVQALTDEQKEKLRQVGRECQEQTGVSDETINKVRAGESVDDPKLKEQSLCIWKKIGLVNESGDIDVETLKSRVKAAVENDEEVDAVIEKCTAKKDTPEETVHNAFRCLMQNRPKFSPVD